MIKTWQGEMRMPKAMRTGEPKETALSQNAHPLSSTGLAKRVYPFTFRSKSMGDVDGR